MSFRRSDTIPILLIYTYVLYKDHWAIYALYRDIILPMLCLLHNYLEYTCVCEQVGHMIFGPIN